jgi:hypothetical protein
LADGKHHTEEFPSEEMLLKLYRKFVYEQTNQVVTSKTEEGTADFPGIIGQLIATAFAIEVVGME